MARRALSQRFLTHWAVQVGRIAEGPFDSIRGCAEGVATAPIVAVSWVLLSSVGIPNGIDAVDETVIEGVVLGEFEPSSAARGVGDLYGDVVRSVEPNNHD